MLHQLPLKKGQLLLQVRECKSMESRWEPWNVLVPWLETMYCCGCPAANPFCLPWPPPRWCPTAVARTFSLSCGSGEGPAREGLRAALAWSDKSNARGEPGHKISIVSVGKTEAGEGGWHAGWVTNTELQIPGSILHGRGLWPSALCWTVLRLKPPLLLWALTGWSGWRRGACGQWWDQPEAHWLFGFSLGREHQEVPLPPFLPCVREPTCITLHCAVSKTAAAAPWHYKSKWLERLFVSMPAKEGASLVL